MPRLQAILLAFIFLAIGLARSGYAFGQDATAPVAPDPDKALSPGDTVNFEIVEDKGAPVKLRVSDTGYLQIPYVGNVAVSGKNCDEAAAQIKKLLESKYYFTATVKLGIDQIAPVKPHPPLKVSVSGKVVNTGLIEIPFGTTMTVSQAINKAGGATQFGDLHKVTLTRKNPDGTGKVIRLDIDAVLHKGDTKNDLELQDGDSIIVGAKIINWGGVQ